MSVPQSVDVRNLPPGERKARVAEMVGEAIDKGLKVAVFVYEPGNRGAEAMVRALCAFAGNPFPEDTI